VAKQSGIADNFYVSQFNVSGDTQALGSIGGGVAVIDVTGIDQSAYDRVGGLRDGRIEWTSFFNDATGRAHLALRGLPATDRVCSYFRGTALGSPAASVVAKQINYDGTRPTDGSFTLAVSAQSNGYGLTWGRQLTAGLRTDTAATNGASIDTAASASFGWSAFLHVTAFTGTDVTVKIQDSADNAAWADLSGGSFAQITAATSERIAAVTPTATVRRYVRAVTVTTGGVTSVTFAVNFAKNDTVAVTY
jgi:hypothetical protein